MFGIRPELGIDLGTCNTRIYIKGKGIVLDEPSVAVVVRETNKMAWAGAESGLMMRPEAFMWIWPIRDGTITNIEFAGKMLRYFISKVLPPPRFFKPRMVIGIPCCANEDEKRAIEKCAYKSGAKEVIVIEKILASAIGAGIPIAEPQGRMICDIGGGITEIAVISQCKIVTASSIRLGGNTFDEAIKKHLYSIDNLIISERMAERIKIEIANAVFDKSITTINIKGYDVINGLPRWLQIRVNDTIVGLTRRQRREWRGGQIFMQEIKEVLEEPVTRIINEIKAILAKAPPELAADIANYGIVMTGGGSLLKDLDKRITEVTGIPVIIAEQPHHCASMGTGMYFEHF